MSNNTIKRITTLNLLPLGDSGIVKKIIVEGNKKRRFIDLGFVDDTEIKAVQKSPAGDPIAYYIRGTVIALRLEEASNIIIEM